MVDKAVPYNWNILREMTRKPSYDYLWLKSPGARKRHISKLWEAAEPASVQFHSV